MNMIRKLYINKYYEDRRKIISYKEKIQVGWSTSRGFLDSYKYLQEIIGYPIQYLIDSDPNKHEKILEGKVIYTPNKILEEQGKVFVWIFSDSYFFEIAELLEKYGFVEFRDFCRGTKEYIQKLLYVEPNE
jgi:hypothetical protein